MSNAIAVVIDHLEFASKDAANEYFSAILNRYGFGDRLSDKDEMDLRAVLAAHPDRDVKLGGQEVSHFEVRQYKFGKPTFFLIRADGTAVDISYQRSLSIRR